MQSQLKNMGVTVKPQVVYRAWIGNYKITMKIALSRERGHLRQIHELKIKENHAGRSTLLCKLDLKAANVEQTHTHTHGKMTVNEISSRFFFAAQSFTASVTEIAVMGGSSIIMRSYDSNVFSFILFRTLVLINFS